MKSPCLNERALILSLQPCSGQNDSGMTNLSFRAGNEWAGVLLFPYREIRMKKTAPRGPIKDKKDRATWTGSGPDGSL